MKNLPVITSIGLITGFAIFPLLSFSIRQSFFLSILAIMILDLIICIDEFLSFSKYYKTNLFSDKKIPKSEKENNKSKYKDFKTKLNIVLKKNCIEKGQENTDKICTTTFNKINTLSKWVKKSIYKKDKKEQITNVYMEK